MNDSRETKQPMSNDIPETVMHMLQGSQSEKEMRIFLQWYQTSQDHRELYYQLKHLYELRKDGIYPGETEITESWERLWNKIDQPHTTYRLSGAGRQHKPFVHIVKYGSVAVITVLFIMSGMYLFQKNRAGVKWTEVRTARQSAPQTVILPDGSTVLLNASSWLKYPVRFSSRNREVFLDGEAYFDVVKNERHTFIVHTDRQTIRVLGTQLNVLGYSSDTYTITTLVSGKVKLQSSVSGINPENEIVMRPNQQVYFDKKRNETMLSEIDPQDALSWINGTYSFRDTPLEMITGRLEKMYGFTFVIPDQTDRNEKYTGKFFAGQSMEEIAAILNFKGQFRTNISNDTICLQRR